MSRLKPGNSKPLLKTMTAETTVVLLIAGQAAAINIHHDIIFSVNVLN